MHFDFGVGCTIVPVDTRCIHFRKRLDEPGKTAGPEPLHALS